MVKEKTMVAIPTDILARYSWCECGHEQDRHAGGLNQSGNPKAHAGGCRLCDCMEFALKGRADKRIQDEMKKRTDAKARNPKPP